MWFDVMYVLLGGVIGACVAMEWARAKRIAAQRQREKDNGELNALRLRLDQAHQQRLDDAETVRRQQAQIAYQIGWTQGYDAARRQAGLDRVIY